MKDAGTNTHTHTVWMWRGVRISFSLCLSLGEPSGQHTALDVPELEALEDPHSHTCTHKCPFLHFRYQVYSILQSGGCRTHTCLKVPCLSQRTPIKCSRPVAPAKCSCCRRTSARDIRKKIAFLCVSFI